MIRLLFQGDSVTDAGRDKRNFHDMGKGYPHFAARGIREALPDAEIEMINLGISGNRTDQLFDRLYPDAIELAPDVISILIGINDVWHRFGASRIETTPEQTEANYRAILKRIRTQTSARIVMLQPFLLDCEKNLHLRPGLNELLPIVKRLADEYADLYIPLDELFNEAMKTQPEPCYYSADGVHPNENGSAFIGEQYAKAILPLLKDTLQ
ncbi:MAG: SGNH/GDSL hydrolase family protein [Clostridia bacterium]|nr:SGNH/GDSL hydrolase family protein [Clostridia bacterium]